MRLSQNAAVLPTTAIGYKAPAPGWVSTNRLSPGLLSRAVLEKFACIQMLDVHLPTTDASEVVLSRYTEPERDVCLLLEHLKWTLPVQAPPKFTVQTKMRI